MKITQQAIDAFIDDQKHQKILTVITMLQAGMTGYAVAKELGINTSTVQSIKDKYIKGGK